MSLVNLIPQSNIFILDHSVHPSRMAKPRFLALPGKGLKDGHHASHAAVKDGDGNVLPRLRRKVPGHPKSGHSQKQTNSLKIAT